MLAQQLCKKCSSYAIFKSNMQVILCTSSDSNAKKNIVKLTLLYQKINTRFVEHPLTDE